MQLIVLLVVAVVIAFLARAQLNRGPVKPDEVLPHSDNTELPQLPLRPENYEAFGRDIENFMQNSADEKLRSVDESTR